MYATKQKKEDLLISIDSKRMQMIASAETQGLHNEVTLQKSRELDVLILTYLKKQLYN